MAGDITSSKLDVSEAIRRPLYLIFSYGLYHFTCCGRCRFEHRFRPGWHPGPLLAGRNRRCRPTRCGFASILFPVYLYILGHRGFFHSPFLGLIISFLLMILFFREEVLFSGRWFRYFSVFFLVWMSHGLLDALTNGGRGVAFFSPFFSDRFFLPWTPIQVSPMRIKSFFTPRGWSVFKSELVWIWLPGLLLVSLSRLIRFWFRN